MRPGPMMHANYYKNWHTISHNKPASLCLRIVFTRANHFSHVLMHCAGSMCSAQIVIRWLRHRADGKNYARLPYARTQVGFCSAYASGKAEIAERMSACTSLHVMASVQSHGMWYRA